MDSGASICSGGGIRTRDLRVMSPVSYQLLHPAMLVLKGDSLPVSSMACDRSIHLHLSEQVAISRS